MFGCYFIYREQTEQRIRNHEFLRLEPPIFPGRFKKAGAAMKMLVAGRKMISMSWKEDYAHEDRHSTLN